jgi:hypothetical protein
MGTKCKIHIVPVVVFQWLLWCTLASWPVGGADPFPPLGLVVWIVCINYTETQKMDARREHEMTWNNNPPKKVSWQQQKFTYHTVPVVWQGPTPVYTPSHCGVAKATKPQRQHRVSMVAGILHGKVAMATTAFGIMVSVLGVVWSCWRFLCQNEPQQNNTALSRKQNSLDFAVREMCSLSKQEQFSGQRGI